jgi:hypothetical protein
MEDVLQSASKHKNITEVYEVVKTAEVVRDGKERFRIEVIKSYNPSERGIDTHYDVLCWKYDYYHLQPSYPRTTEGDIINYEQELTDARIVGAWSIPWLHEQTAELALRRAIDYLATGTI